MNECPGCGRRELLLWLAAGTLSGEEAEVAKNAVATCERCREAFRLDQILSESLRTSHPASELPPAALVDLAASPRRDLTHIPPADREIVSILRAVADEEERRSSTWIRGLLNVRDRALSWSPAWGYLLILVLLYPAYRGLRPESFGPGPRLLTQPVALGDPARASSGEAGVVQAGDDSVVSVFVPVDPAYRYAFAIRSESGRIVFRAEDVVPFDGIGTFAVLLPAKSLAPGRYEVLIDEIDDSAATRSNVYRFTFSMEQE